MNAAAKTVICDRRNEKPNFRRNGRTIEMDDSELNRADSLELKSFARSFVSVSNYIDHLVHTFEIALCSICIVHTHRHNTQTLEQSSVESISKM